MNNLNIKNQKGRSMIEMLGVLAIIGVLSVGGIAGYSKAMQKYRINKTIEQVSQIVTNVRTFFASQNNYSDLNTCRAEENTCAEKQKILIKAKIIPDEMIEDGTKSNFKQFKTEFGDISLISSSTLGNRYFVLTLLDLPEDACIELATYDWRANSGNSIYQMSVNGDCPECDLGMSTCVSGNGVICAKDMPMSIDKATEACFSMTPPYISFVFK